MLLALEAPERAVVQQKGTAMGLVLFVRVAAPKMVVVPGAPIVRLADSAGADSRNPKNSAFRQLALGCDR